MSDAYSIFVGAWVITGGSSAGVMGIVGEAIQQRAITSGDRDKIVCLGIPTWGCIAGREQLDGEGVRCVQTSLVHSVTIITFVTWVICWGR